MNCRTLRPGWIPPLFLFAGLGLLGCPSTAAESSETISLAGSWRFALDRRDAGIDERWFARPLPERVKLPGSLPQQGIGDPVTTNTAWTGGIVDKTWFTAPEYENYRRPGNVKVPFWLQPETYYAGAAWYQRELTIPTKWTDRRIVLFLERPHWETRVWVGDQLVGTNNALGTPHEFELGLLPPGKHRLTIRVDNRMVVDVGRDSHSVSDHTQGNWNGIVGRIELQATPTVWIADLQVTPHAANRSITVQGRIGNRSSREGRGQLWLVVNPEEARRRSTISSRLPPTVQELTWTGSGGSFEATLAMGPDAPLWDEFEPVMHRLTATLESGEGASRQTASRTVSFGLREFGTQGTQFVINGRKTFLRGTLECSIFPKTGHPPVDVASWRKVILAAKAHGLNNLRFHSHCPPEAAFIAADELGMYLHVECSSWANSSTTLGDGKPVDPWIYDEADRILRYYGNHPSFVMLLYGNEPGGAKHKEYLAKWVEHYKTKDPRRLYSSGAGWPQLPENQFHVAPDPRIQAWGGGLRSRINARPPETVTDYRDYIAARKVPVVSHEIGQWCVYPNFAEVKKYTGYLKPRNFEIFRDKLASNHLADRAADFLLASGKLQTLCYKEDIESALRTPGMGGFQLLDLHDFPGQGTALVGVLDPFWEGKGYVTPQEYSRFCNATVPLARLPRRVFVSHEKLEADLEIAHFGPHPLENAVPVWMLVDDSGRVVASERLPARTIPVDNAVALGKVVFALDGLPAAARYRLVLGLAGTGVQNDWDIWVYPPTVSTTPPNGIVVTDELNERALLSLRAGGKVLLLPPPQRVKGDRQGRVALGFSSIFWNTAWTGRQPPHTLGILCDPDHPALARFPTDYHSNWQWWYLVTRAGAMILDDLPPQLRPIVQVVDDWVTARRLALVFEARVAKGRLLVCSIDVRSGTDQNPVARQMLASLLAYMEGKRFKPAVELTVEQVSALMTAPSAMGSLGGRILKASSAEPGHESVLAIDGDPSTFWHSGWTGGPAGFPHELQVSFAESAVLRGFAAVPRQDGNRNGWIKDYELFVSDDGQTWGAPVARGAFPAANTPHQVLFAQPCRARYVRLVALSGHANGPWASLAELDMILTDK